MFLPKYIYFYTACSLAHTEQYYCAAMRHHRVISPSATRIFVVGKHPRAELKFIEALINDNANNSLST